MLQDLKLDPIYDGFLFLAESARNPPFLLSHRHIELELNVVVRGTVTYVVGGERFTFGGRSLFWLFPDQEHQVIDRTPDAQYYVAVFKPELIAASCRGKAYRGLSATAPREGGIMHTTLDSDSFGFLRRMMEWIMEGALDSDTLNREGGFGAESAFRFRHHDPDGLNAGLHHLLLVCWKLQKAGKNRQQAVRLHPSISKALEILADDQWSGNLGDLARQCGFSEAHFSRTFARQVGVPLSRYRNSLRLARFWECMGGPGAPTITEAVYAAGFGSYAQFYKVFADAHGHGPRAHLSKPED